MLFSANLNSALLTPRLDYTGQDPPQHSLHDRQCDFCGWLHPLDSLCPAWLVSYHFCFCLHYPRIAPPHPFSCSKESAEGYNQPNDHSIGAREMRGLN